MQCTYLVILWCVFTQPVRPTHPTQPNLYRLQAITKLIFSPSLCPVIAHVRPVPWLYTFFYYTLGVLTWQQGIRSTYEAPWAKAVTHQKRTAGVMGRVDCEAPQVRRLAFTLPSSSACLHSCSALGRCRKHSRAQCLASGSSS